MSLEMETQRRRDGMMRRAQMGESGVPQNENAADCRLAAGKSLAPATSSPINALAGSGDSFTLSTPAEEMAAFDQLPREVREALDGADHGWSAVNVLARWQAAVARYGVSRATRKAISVIRGEAPGRVSSG